MKLMKMSLISLVVISVVILGTVLLTSPKYGMGLLTDNTVGASQLSDSEMQIHHNFQIVNKSTTVGQTRVSVRKPDMDIDEFRGSFYLPSDGEIRQFKSDYGNVSVDRINDGYYKATLDLNESRSRFSFVYSYDINSLTMEHTEDLRTHTINTGMDGEQTAKIYANMDVDSVVEHGSYNTDIEGNEVTVSSDGNINIQVVTGESDYEVSGVSIYDEANVTSEYIEVANLRRMETILHKTMGFEDPEISHPIVLQEDDDFNSNKHTDSRVGGLYQSGVSKIPESTFVRDQGLSVIAHELVHSKNDQVGSVPRWFDEGSAMYLQSIVADEFDELYVPPFSQEYGHPEGCLETRANGCTVYSSSSDADDLYRYLQDPSLEDAWTENRSFAYDLADLYTRYTVKSEFDQNSLEPYYESILSNENGSKDITSDELLEVAGHNGLEPCQNSKSSTENVRECIDSYNDYSPKPDSMIADVSNVG